MLELFTRRQINFAIILVAISLLLFQIFSSLYPVDWSIWKHSAPLSSLLFNLFGERLLSNALFDFFAATFLIGIQLFAVYKIISSIRNIEKYALLSAWLYNLLLHLSPQWSKFSPILIASTLVIIMLYVFFKNIAENKNNFIFTIGLLLGLAFMFWYPTIMLLAFLFFALYLYNLLSVKRLVIICLSFSIPIIHFVGIHFLNNDFLGAVFAFYSFHVNKIMFEAIDIKLWLSNIFLFGLVTVGFVQALSLSARSAKISRLFFNSLLVLMVFVGIGFFLSINKYHYSLLLLLLPFSLYLTIFFNNIKRKITAEFIHIALISAILFNFVYQILIKTP